MALWNSIVETLLPFSFLEYGFMRNALLAVLLLCPTLAMMGTMVVNRSMAFFSDSLGHSAMTGMALGVLFGIADPMWAAMLFGVVFAVGLVWVKSRSAASTDTTISVFSAAAMALGLVILSVKGGLAKYAGYLVGDLLAVSAQDIGALAVVALLVLVYCVVAYNALSLTSVNDALAASRGVNQRLVEYLFAVVVAAAVMVSIRWVGVLLINALLVLPAAAARNVARSVKGYFWIAVGLSLFCGVAGLVLSYYLGTASGATIVLIAAAAYFLTLPFVRR